MTTAPTLPIPEARISKRLRLILDAGYVFQGIDANDRGTTLNLVLQEGEDVFDWNTIRIAMSAAMKRVRKPKPKKQPAADAPAKPQGS